MKRVLIFCWILLGLPPAHATVRVFIQQTNGQALVSYECTAGEVVRSFALDVTVDQGQIIGITNYFQGLSTAGAQGYGIFPASFRDHVTVLSGTNADWTSSAYSPLAVPADNPGGTLPGLNSSGVTLELGAIWDPAVAAAIPPASGILCTLQLSQTANVDIGSNNARGSIIPWPSDLAITTSFTGALVGPAILSTSINSGSFTVLFQSGELETAPAAVGPWIGTGNTTGTYTETIGGTPARFFRVHAQ